MRYAVELFFDEVADTRVRGLWSALAAADVPAAPFLTDTYRPHVSVASFEAEAVEPLLPPLRRALGSAVGLRLPLAALGFFADGGPQRAFLSVAASDALLRLHREVAQVLARTGATPRPFYVAGAWTPHCTLPVEVADAGAIFAAVRRFGLPVAAETRESNVVELSTGAPVGRLL